MQMMPGMIAGDTSFMSFMNPGLADCEWALSNIFAFCYSGSQMQNPVNESPHRGEKIACKLLCRFPSLGSCL